MAHKPPETLRVPPQSVDSERALLGAIMLRPEGLIDVTDLLTSESFYTGKHQVIYRAMAELFAKGDPIDLLSITGHLEERGLLESAGGRSYLVELVDATPSAGNLKYYAQVVHRKHSLRNLISAADDIAELGYNEVDDLEDILDRAEKRVYDVTSSPTFHAFTPIAESLGQAWDRLEHLHQSKEEIRGIRTGFKGLDDILAGLQKSDLVILAARPSMGKTALALDIARQTATLYNNPVGVFSLEMSSQQLVDRMLAAEARVDAWKLRTGKLSHEEDFARIRDALDRLSGAPIYIDDQPGSTILRMRSVARRLKREKGLSLIIVDYLQLMVPTGARASDSLVQQVTEISRSLKHLARELDVPVLALSQLSREVEKRRGKPRLSDLRDSGSIEQDADVVMFIHRDDRMNETSDRPNIAEIMIEKHRNGPTGKIDLYFDEKKTTFLTMEKSDFTAFETSTEPPGTF